LKLPGNKLLTAGGGCVLEHLRAENISLVHAFIFGLGLTKIVERLCSEFSGMLPIQPIPLKEWAQHLYFPDKPKEVLCYVAIITALFVYYAANYTLIFIKRRQSPLLLRLSRGVGPCLAYGFSIAVINAVVVRCYAFSSSWIYLAAASFFWLGFWLLPFLPFRTNVLNDMDRLAVTPNRAGQPSYVTFDRTTGIKINYLAVASSLLLALLCINLFNMFVPYTGKRLRIGNDYADICEETQLSRGYVSNCEYFERLNGATGPIARSADSVAFFKKNWVELYAQSYLGWFMHHHNALLAPINEYSLGKGFSSINQQYGLLNIIGLSYLLKATGGITFQNYFRTLYSFYPVYFLLFFALAFLFSRNINFVLLTAVLSLTFLNLLGHTDISLAPGFNPIRQLGFIFVAASLFLYFSERRVFYLALTVLFAAFFVLSNTEFGLFAVSALLITLLLRIVIEGRKADPREVVAIIMICLLTALIIWLGAGKNPSSQYYLRGISGPMIMRARFNRLIGSICLLYVFLFKVLHTRHDLKYIALFLFFYCQGILIYYVWNPASNHFYSIAAPIVLAVAVFLKIWLDQTRIKLHGNLVLVALSLACLFTFYLPSLQHYYKEKREYDRVFEDHRVYQWDLPTVKFGSTMDPRPFYESVNMIRKYSGADSSIYMISKFDNFLPFLAGKYSAMPFNELGTSLLTEKEVRLSIEKIMVDRPFHIFVDAEIARPSEVTPAYAFALKHIDWITTKQPDTFLSRVRNKIAMLDELKHVFAGVKAYYRPLEKGGLLSVYERR